VLTGMTVPATQATGQAVVRIAAQHRIAVIAIATRLFQHKHGRWPNELSELNEFGIATEQLIPPGDKPFGFSVASDTVAILWGAALYRRVESTPDAVPSLDSQDEMVKVATWEIRVKR
jgi:hypothetical protein